MKSINKTNAGSISERLDIAMKTFGDKEAITSYRGGNADTCLTYAQLNDDINQFSLFLSRYDLKKGDRVILLLEKSLIQVVAHIALMKSGMVVVPLNPGFKKDELAYLFHDAGANLIITGPEKKEVVQSLESGTDILEIPVSVPYRELDFFRSVSGSLKTPVLTKDDPGLIIYTSGTTGDPKGAVLTHGNLMADADNIISIWEISREDRLLHTLPLFHVHGLCFALHTALLSGSHILFLDRFSNDTVLEHLSSQNTREKCSIFMAVPAMYTRIMDHMGDNDDFDFSHLRLLTSGSAPLLEKEFQRITRIFGREPVEREGMSETGMNFSNPLRGEKKPGSIGLPLPGVLVRIVDTETLLDVPVDTVGEIWLKSPCITREYWKKPEETKNTFEKGWFRTGDLGKKDASGYYYLTDRIKHLIITAGENVSAKEVERVINDIDGVKEASVVGIKDHTWGEKVVALVERIPGTRIDDTAIISVCREKLHNLKCPKTILFTDTIPKNTMGKVLKEKVKDFFLL